MNKKNILCLFFLLAFLASCRKCPTHDELQGTWKEDGANGRKMIFSGDILYYFHDTTTDTLTYTLDKKHVTLWTTPLRNPSSGGNSYSMAYHKRKNILTIMGLYAVAFGEVSETNFKKQ
jgi:hypothetical protein